MTSNPSRRRGRWSPALITTFAVATLASACSSSSTTSPPSATTSTTSTTATTATTATAATAAAPTTQPGGAIATGAITCDEVTGSITFDPPLTTGGTSPETTQISLTPSGCVTTGSDAQVTSAAATATLSSATNNCASLLSSKPVAVAASYTPSSVHASVVAFSGYAIVSAPTTADVGFSLPGSGGTATVTGSFAGTDKGAKSTATIYSTMTPTQALAACAAAGGLVSLSLAAGSVTLS